MKKRIKIFAMTCLSIGLLSIVGIQTGNETVNAVFGIENVEACPQSAMNNGRCSFFGTYSVNPGGLVNCDSTHGGGGGPTTLPPGGGGGGGN